MVVWAVYQLTTMLARFRYKTPEQRKSEDVSSPNGNSINKCPARARQTHRPGWAEAAAGTAYPHHFVVVREWSGVEWKSRARIPAAPFAESDRAGSACQDVVPQPHQKPRAEEAAIQFLGVAPPALPDITNQPAGDHHRARAGMGLDLASERGKSGNACG
jgi:hypothetical protein